MASFMIFGLPTLSMQQCSNKSYSNIRFCRQSQNPHFNQGLLSFPALQKKNNACFSNNIIRKCYHNNNHLEVDIISKDCIKPSAPTPEHLSSYEVSILDQIYPHIYTSFVYFYSNDHQNDSKWTDVNDLTLKRIQLLKQSLSETLTRFYPLAGRVKDYRHINCNDEGVYFVEAKVNQSVYNFLSEPGNKPVEPLLPFGSIPMKLSLKTCVVMIQLTTFSCGGISIGLCASHKIMDANSIATFIKAWAATARASPEDICPKFVSPSIFPSTLTLPKSTFIYSISLYFKKGKSTTKRFVFCASSLTKLKRKGGASRALGVTGLIWKCAIKALKARKVCIKKSSALTMAVNLRERSMPPLPLSSMGNIIWVSLVTHRLEGEEVDLGSAVQCLKNSVQKINGEFVESMKGEKGSQNVSKYLNEAKTFYSNDNAEYILMTSMCNSGMYEADFGWGKPLWFTCARPGSTDPNIPQATNFVQLMDTRNGKGIEAWVTLSNEDMAIFEQDPELLEMASVEPSPLY